MSELEAFFNRDIVLDEAAFDAAIEEFAQLSVDLQKLRTTIEDMMHGLEVGFNTPAGAKFVNACEKSLYKPLDDQKLVLDHISKTLSESRQAYQSVFREYESLQTAIKQVEH